MAPPTSAQLDNVMSFPSNLLTNIKIRYNGLAKTTPDLPNQNYLFLTSAAESHTRPIVFGRTVSALPDMDHHCYGTYLAISV